MESKETYLILLTIFVVVVASSLLIIWGKKYRNIEEKVTYKPVIDEFIDEEEKHYHLLFQSYRIDTTNNDVKILINRITSHNRMIQQNSYKEGFWNGQQAKIEEVKMTPEEKNTFAWPPDPGNAVADNKTHLKAEAQQVFKMEFDKGKITSVKLNNGDEL